MQDMKEAFRGLSMLGQLSLQMLIPILIGVFGGIWLDGQFGCSPWCTAAGAMIGIASAFRNLYVWSMRQIRRSKDSERARQAVREMGLQQNEQQKEDTHDRIQ